jgi:hypothetical protein
LREVSTGDRRYRILAFESEGQWRAHAEELPGGNRFGPECAAPSEPEAIERMARWLSWQHEHAAALEALQSAERAYHRTIAGSAFVSPVEGPSAVELQKESLQEVEAARLRLDEIRANKPE